MLRLTSPPTGAASRMSLNRRPFTKLECLFNKIVFLLSSPLFHKVRREDLPARLDVTTLPKALLHFIRDDNFVNPDPDGCFLLTPNPGFLTMRLVYSGPSS